MLFFLSSKINRKVKYTKKKHSIVDGKIMYSDLNVPAEPLFSPKNMLVGKPDYIVKNDNNIIPIEMKSSMSLKPWKSHILQLAAYCQLIEDTYGGFVPFGILVYNSSQQFRITFDPKIRFELESTIKKMRYLQRTGKVARNHNDPHKCKKCSMKSHCEMLIS